ncbi:MULTISPECIES: HAMP domain-containing sensor histidine kinase [unclassified Mycobacterium]|uniref:HAMP domain-containing sensor histidine kinase n=1 Tax=unclassified Mycobacterium TaxID=2642494 RepID=UPI0029C6EED5|nr:MULTISPECIES: HAMP domain-containing sensor histidine kinase [unclassified Mycobacterium]
MTAFAQQPHVAASAEFESNLAQPTKRPSRWSMGNWPVRWKVFAIVLVPLLLAGAFGGLRIYSGWTAASELRLATDRAALVPATEEYTAALEGAMLANSTGADPQPALAAFDDSKQNLQRRLADTDVSPDVAKGVTTLLEGGQALLDKVTANSIGLRDRITSYAPILLTAEDVVNGSVRVDDEGIRTEALGLSRAMGARGQMMMQQLLVNRGGELPEPELRTSMITLAGTEPSTLFGISQVLGVGSPDAQKLQEEFVKRMGMISDPAVPLVNNPDYSQSLATTNEIALSVIKSTSNAVSSAVEDQASAKRTEAIRDSAIVAAAMLVALLIVTFVARTLVRPLRRLRDGALKVAHEDLARELERVRAGGAVGPVQLLPVQTTEEIGQVAHAVDELHEQAVLLAGEQANLQMQVDDMFETLSRRSRSLVDQQLTLIDSLERNEEDPERLESLFRLDHLAARMRRNGANLLVLAGSKIPREQADPVPVAALINAAASEVEDYARVITASVPESEVLGVAAGDLVHLLAELLDNALRYSPPISQVRVSAVHTGNGGLVIEVSDIGLGMTDSDLRVANVRLQSGGEVNPYTARHMGLFVVGRLATQHGLVVRLRSTVAGDQNSGTTAGVFIPAGLLIEHAGSYQDNGQGYPVAADAHAGIATALSLDAGPVDNGQYAEYDESDEYDEYGTGYGAEPEYPAAEYRNGHADIPVSLLPQRNPGASGISGIPSVPDEPVAEPESDWLEDEWPEDSMPAQTPPHAPEEPPVAPPQWTQADRPAPTPTNTSAFFASRDQVPSQYREPSQPATNGVPGQHANGVPSQPPVPVEPPAPVEPVEVVEPAASESVPQAEPAAATDSDGSIFSKMLSEWLIDDPVELAASTDLDWQTVWDKGWSAAAAAADAPVEQHTEHGLPMRDPGARLVPGAADAPEHGHGANGNGNGNGRHRNGDADAEGDAGSAELPHRDPDAVRETISNHFGGVHAGRTHARDSREADER